MTVRRILTACMTAVLLAGGASSAVAADQSVVADEALRACINADLKRPKSTAITSEDMAGIEVLHCQYMGVASLTGLEYATGLAELWVDGPKLRDLTPLANLSSLEVLRIDSAQLSDLTPLSGLTALRHLAVADGPDVIVANFRDKRGPLTDLSPLGALTNLVTLELYGMQASDISALTSLKNLRELIIENAPVGDVTPLSRMTQLEWLLLAGTDVDNVAPLKDLTHLKRLDVRLSRVADLSPLNRLGGAPYAFTGQDIIRHAGQKGTLENPLRTITGASITQVSKAVNVSFGNGIFQLTDPSREGSVTFESEERIGTFPVTFTGVLTILPYQADQEPPAPPTSEPIPDPEPVSTPTPEPTSPLPAPMRPSPTVTPSRSGDPLAHTGTSGARVALISGILGVLGCGLVARRRSRVSTR